MLLTGNCATYMKYAMQGNQDLNVIGPEDSHIFLDDEKIGESFIIKDVGFPKKDVVEKKTVRIEKTGYAPQVIELKKGTNKWIWGNFLFLLGAPIGFGIDYLSGVFESFTPLNIKADLIRDEKYKVDLNSPTQKKYKAVLDESSKIPVVITYSNLSAVNIEKLDEKGNVIPNANDEYTSIFQNQSNVKTLSPGTYRIKGIYQTSRRSGNTITTYTAKKAGEMILTIPGGGAGAFCGLIDKEKKATSFRFIHINEPSAKSLEGFLPRAQLSNRIAGSCDGIFGLQDLLTQ
ncbi:hypothetical protein CH368_00160 [Leptospira levettii]|nr:hypothetical protein CH368_00160 [Leptospira levettii]